METGDDNLLEIIARNIDSILKPLSNQTRQQILLTLSKGPMTYTDILSTLKLESGSFYWHLGKMEGLIQQTQDKNYYLSPLGEKAVELLTTGGIVKELSAPEPDWYLSIRSVVSRLNQLPMWIKFQQVLIALFVISYVFSTFGVIMIGTLSISSSSTLGSSLSSVVISISLMVGLLILVLKVLNQFGMIGLDSVDWSRLIIGLYLTSLPITIVGFVELIDVYILLENIVYIVLIFIFSIFGLFLNIISTTAIIDEELETGFKNAMIVNLIVYYPIVLLSFLLASLF